MTHMNGYRFVLVPDHPVASPSGHVREHVLVAEIALGRFLPDGAVVHHDDENKLNNYSDGNLVICENRAHHNFIHRRMRALKECGNPDWLRCPICKTWDAPENLYVRTAHNRFGQARHPACHAADVKRRAQEKAANALLRNLPSPPMVQDMASELILDRSDSGIDSMVAGWKNGSEYDLRVKVRQTSTDSKSAKFELVQATDETEEAETEEEYPAEKPKMGKPSIVISE